MPETDLTISGCGGSKIWVDTPKITADGGSAYPRLIIPATLYLNPIRKEQAEYFVISFDKCNLFLQDNSCKITDGKSNFNPYPVHSLVSIPCTIEFTFDMNKIKELEKYRKGDIRFRLDFYFDASLYKILDNNRNKPIKSEPHFCQLNIEIPQSQWIKKILPSFGYLDIWLVELPSAKKMFRVSWKYLAIGAGVFGMIKMFFWFSKLLWK